MLLLPLPFRLFVDVAVTATVFFAVVIAVIAPGWLATSASASAAPALMAVNTLISVTAVGWRCHKQATLGGNLSVSVSVCVQCTDPGKC